MSDLISRQAAIGAIQKEYADTEGGDDKCAVWKNIGLTNALHVIQDLPSVQPEIIRCKDCTRFDKKRGCNLVEGLNIAKADSFCSWAERRGEEDAVD